MKKQLFLPTILIALFLVMFQTLSVNAAPYPFNAWYGGTNVAISGNFFASASNTLEIFNATASNTITLSVPSNGPLTNAYLFVNNVETANIALTSSVGNVVFTIQPWGSALAYNTPATSAGTTTGSGNYLVGTYPFNVIATNEIVPNSPIGQTLSLFTSNIPAAVGTAIATTPANTFTINPATLSLTLNTIPSYTYNGFVPPVTGTFTLKNGGIVKQPAVNSLTIQLQNTTANTPYYSYNAFNTIATPTTSNTFIFPALATPYSSAGTYIFNALISVLNQNYTITSSTGNSLTIGNTLVIGVNTLKLGSPPYIFSNYSGSAYYNSNTNTYVSPYYTLDKFVFTGIAALANNNANWNLYVNGALYSTTASSTSWSTQGVPGTYTLLFTNAGNNNYTANSISETLHVQQPGSGVPSSPPPVTTTIPPTTTIKPIIKHIVNITTSSYSSVLNITTTPFTLNYTNEHLILKLTSNSSTGISTNVTLSNVTALVKNMTNKNYTKLDVFNFTSLQKISVNATYSYNCSLNNVSAFELVNNTYTKLNSTENASACVLSFAIPSDPIIAIFSYKPLATAITTTSTTVPSNVVTTTVSTTTAPITPAAPHNTLLIIAIVIIIIIVIAAAAYLIKRNKKR